MIINTTSEGVTLAKKLETDSAAFYEALAKKFPAKAETFLAFAKENIKNISNTERTYYGVVTDAIEGCYAFNLDTDNYVLDTKLAAKAGEKDAAAQAVKMEEKIVAYYTLAGEQGRALMADLPRAFTLLAKKRANRIETLKAL
jgi:hypothetical protein